MGHFVTRTIIGVSLVIASSSALGQDCGWEAIGVPDLSSGLWRFGSSVAYDDGSGSALYADVTMNVSNDQSELYSGFAKWDGDAWQPLDTVQGQLGHMIVYDAGGGPMIYAAVQLGDFPSDGFDLARFDGDSWRMFGTLPDGSILRLAVYDSGNGPELYIGGDFTHIAGQPANGLARYDGQSYRAAGEGLDGSISDFAIFDPGSGSELFMTGVFASVGGQPAQDLARWDGKTMRPLDGLGIWDQANVLEVFDDGAGPALYVGGILDQAGGVPVGGLAKWDGQAWSAVDDIDLNSVQDLAVFDDGQGPALYITGGFENPNGLDFRFLTRWDGQAWSRVGGDIAYFHSSTQTELNIEAITLDAGPRLMLGGHFTYIGDRLCNNVALWDGVQWSALGRARAAEVNSIAVFDDGDGLALFIAGLFDQIGGIEANNIARWDGAQWSSLNQGVHGRVEKLRVIDYGFGPALFVAGRFDKVGDEPSVCIAKWDDRGWTSMSANLRDFGFFSTSGSVVHDIQIFDDGTRRGLVLGGAGLAIGDTQERIITAQFLGTTWAATGSQVDVGVVETLGILNANDGQRLFAVNPHSRSSFDFGEWNGNDWTSLREPADTLVQSFSETVFQGEPQLIIGARIVDFNTRGIARWIDGQTTPMGFGIRGNVLTMKHAVMPDGTTHLFAGGSFDEAGAQPVNNIAAWDGLRWYPLGSGPTGMRGTISAFKPVADMAVFDDGSGSALYVVGQLSEAGGMFSPHLAKWNLCLPCHADFNNDGNLNTVDFIAFLNAFNAGHATADYNRDGNIDTLDFLAFLNDFNAGCN